MNPIRRELLNGLFVLVLSTLLSAAIAAFEIKFDLQVWALILVAIAVALGGYVVFEFVLSAEHREKDWLRQVGTPARLEMGLTAGAAGTGLMIEAVKAMKPGSDLTIMLYFDRDGGRSYSFAVTDPAREQLYALIMEQLRGGVIREYKRLICFDPDVFANDYELRAGILRAGEGPGTINKSVAEHCRLMLETPRCFVYAAPVIMRNFVGLYGPDKASMSVDTIDRETGARALLGVMMFHDPPNGEIVEQFRLIERETERRMVAVHRIRFPEDAPDRRAGNSCSCGAMKPRRRHHARRHMQLVHEGDTADLKDARTLLQELGA
jgi:hypothetical protein